MLKALTSQALCAPCAAVLLALAGCAVGPTYHAPAPATATTWHAPVPHGGKAAALQGWWAQFNDAALTQFIAWADADSPTLTQAWARIEQARATLDDPRAPAPCPRSAPRAAPRAPGSRSPPHRPAPRRRAAPGWMHPGRSTFSGRVRRNTEAASARIEAREADWHDARVSLAAEVADTHVQYRACGLLADAYDRELASVTTTEATTATMVKAGLTAPADGALARASLASSRASAVRQRAQCALCC